MHQGGRPAAGLAEAPKGSGVILLVEDEDAVRKLARLVLETSGYTVLESRNARRSGAVRSPRGPDRFAGDRRRNARGRRTRIKLQPGMKVMFMSGHTQDVVLKEGV